MRLWAQKFGRHFAIIRKRPAGRLVDKRYDEVVIIVRGKKHWLWRAGAGLINPTSPRCLQDDARMRIWPHHIADYTR